MAIFAASDLKKWRETNGISAADLAERISCDATTIYRYEAGKLKPNPDVMYQICEALGDVDRWTDWMRTEYPISYGRMHPETSKFDLEGALLSMYGVIDDVLSVQHEVFKDGADGSIDNGDLRRRLQDSITQLLQSAQRVKSLVSIGGKQSGGDL